MCYLQDVYLVSLDPLHKEGVAKRYVLAVLGFLAFFCTYALRVNLSVTMVAMVRDASLEDVTETDGRTLACPDLLVNSSSHLNEKGNLLERGEFDWNANVQGIVLGSFYYGYVITQIPGGLLAEKYSAKWTLGLGILATSALALLTPVVARWSVWVLVCTRACQGLGEGLTYPAMHAMIGRWIPKQERGILSTVIYSGAYIGTVVSLSLSGILCDSDFLGGWPAAFYVLGMFGCSWFVAWIMLVHDSPEKHPSISQEELLQIRMGEDGIQSKLHRSVPWRAILSSVPVWALVVAHFGNNWAFYTVLGDLPTYLTNVLHFDMTQNGTIAAAPNVVEVIVSIVSSIVASKMISSGKFSTTVVRKIMNSIAFFVPATCILFIPFIGCQATAIVILISSVVSLNGFVYSGFNITHLDMSPEFAGTLMGITNCIANVAGFLAPSFVGWMIQDGHTQENWNKVFFATSGIFFTSGLVYNLFSTAEPQKWGSSYEHSEGENDVKTIQRLSISDAT